MTVGEKGHTSAASAGLEISDGYRRVHILWQGVSELSSVKVKIEDCSAWPEVPADAPAASVSPASSGRFVTPENPPRVSVSRASMFKVDLRPFKCPHCDRSFRQASDQQGHIRTHTLERPFVCPYCPKTYSWKASYNMHVRRHAGNQPYTCQLCCMGFTCESTFTKHMQQHD
ncbi:hypothetical protein HPB51_004815 [Rhipicephalus microplus]|uniref:C2H2-type domain-containing protein n=1 Tax=Rhipicephalus microplus TaxID=6941 RepID=A0A9J6E6B7_RHIMP|nr:hypothetical protein HPB51_004815 [Rhipicephalus microplus]